MQPCDPRDKAAAAWGPSGQQAGRGEAEGRPPPSLARRGGSDMAPRSRRGAPIADVRMPADDRHWVRRVLLVSVAVCGLIGSSLGPTTGALAQGPSRSSAGISGVDQAPAAAGAAPTRSSEPRYLTNVGGTLFFTARDGTSGYELWKSNGTAAGTKRVKDINQRPR